MIIGKDVPHSSFGKKVLNHQIFIVIYLFICNLWRESTVLCSTGCIASTVARKLHRWLSMSGIITPLKSSFMKPSGSSQGERSTV